MRSIRIWTKTEDGPTLNEIHFHGTAHGQIVIDDAGLHFAGLQVCSGMEPMQYEIT